MMLSLPCGKVRVACAEFRVRILIVDDEALVRWSLSSGLRAAGYDVVTASSGSEALKLARDRPTPNVVLLDLHLYGVDAYKLIDEIRALAPDCRFLVLTTAAQAAPIARRGSVTVVSKPFDLGAVVDLIAFIAACASR